jgi:hypothetical protein
MYEGQKINFSLGRAIVEGIKTGVVGCVLLNAGGDVASVKASQSVDLGPDPADPCNSARLNLSEPVSKINGEFVANGDNGVAIRFNRAGQVTFRDTKETTVQLLNEMRGGKKTNEILSFSVRQLGKPIDAGRIPMSTRSPSKWCPSR